MAERFFDEAGGMQLVLHAPFGGRINRAWGLALRKRFCRTFDFELQAAATDDGIVLSLGPQHSFPLESVFRFLRPESVREVLAQALLAAPMFATRWRWNATRSLALLRFRNGRKVPTPIQRIRAEDLLAAVFPAVVAGGENHAGGDIEIPEHPLVDETLRDCFEEATDVEGLRAVLEAIERGEVDTIARDTAEPSPMSHEILNANPYAFLDDAPLEERRARAVATRRGLPEDIQGSLGALDAAAIETVAGEAWPEVRDADELHDALLTLGVLTEGDAGPWLSFAEPLVRDGRASWLSVSPGSFRAMVAAERIPLARAVYAGADFDPEVKVPPALAVEMDAGEAAIALVRGRLACSGPMAAGELAERLSLPWKRIEEALAAIEADGQILRGHFTPGRKDGEIEWCDRGLLARIHRLTIGRLRREIEPVSIADFLRFLLRWQHVAPGAQLHGEEGVLKVIEQLQGFELAAGAWEDEVLRSRVAAYQPAWLDALCLGGEVIWGRLAGRNGASSAGFVRPATLAGKAAPITLALRGDLEWLREPVPAGGREALSHAARDVYDWLKTRGASFLPEVVAGSGRLKTEVEDALRELVAAGLVTAYGFQALRSLIGRREREKRLARYRFRNAGGPPPRNAQGRWALLHGTAIETPEVASVERVARQLLRRYGVVARDLLAREAHVPTWRELLLVYRRLEARGEIRGGRFVAGLGGEHFALPEAVEALRAVRRLEARGETVRVSACDPLNLVGILTPGPRVPAMLGNEVAYRDGVPMEP